MCPRVSIYARSRAFLIAILGLVLGTALVTAKKTAPISSSCEPGVPCNRLHCYCTLLTPPPRPCFHMYFVALAWCQRPGRVWSWSTPLLWCVFAGPSTRHCPSLGVHIALHCFRRTMHQFSALVLLHWTPAYNCTCTAINRTESITSTIVLGLNLQSIALWEGHGHNLPLLSCLNYTVSFTPV